MEYGIKQLGILYLILNNEYLIRNFFLILSCLEKINYWLIQWFLKTKSRGCKPRPAFGFSIFFWISAFAGMTKRKQE
jgi:hypothetical protein